ncbi:hypothetical protein [Ktedonospora formicarum]|uniref:Ferredoxin n=1 Tax=Ktedonospora formicarum TaxID=2778364 RepID=A0A8J3HRB4_9CHLR|nr:hypothetical protein [Ktedonospora formicarum]GHO42422.1 hypothetical protein KSX_05850 [Ktedonospora formicarum]
MQNTMLKDQAQDCAHDCLQCHAACMAAVHEGKKRGGGDDSSIALDCAELCLATAHMLLRDSPLAGYACTACASACNHCAGICDQKGMSDVANACRICANSCEQLVKMIP